MSRFGGFSHEVSKGLAQFVDRHRESARKRKIAVFDADGTLWRGDIGEAFFRDQIAKGTIPHAPKSDPWGVYFKESVEGDTAKAFAWLAQWNAGVSEKQLSEWADEFYENNWAPLVFHPMKELARALRDAGFEIWVISGSIRWVVQAGAKHFGIDPARVLGSSVEVRDGKLTDKVVEPVPYRAGKAKLVASVLGEAPLFAAGNTYWDKELLLTSTDQALALHSEHEGEPNFESEQKLKALALEKRWWVQGF